MKYQTLGNSNLKVSRLCLGTMMFADQTDEREADAIVGEARDNGVNYIDVADFYARGETERMVGKLLAPSRDKWVISTKIGNPMSSEPNDGGYSRVWMARGLEQSLKRLRVDCVDILYLHREFNGMNLLEALFGIQEALQRGIIRYWGISNFSGWRIADAVRISDELGIPRPVVSQPNYNILNRKSEAEIFPACLNYGIGSTPYSPLARGVLTAKYSVQGSIPQDSRAGRGDKRLLETEMRDESLHVAQILRQHAAARGASLAQFATAWVLANRAVSSVIAGPRTLEQWRHYLPALSYSVTVEDEALVDSLVSPGHSSTPGYNDPAYPLLPRTQANG